MFLDENILSIFEAGFTKNLSIFEPQIEKRYAYEKQTCRMSRSENCSPNLGKSGLFLKGLTFAIF